MVELIKATYQFILGVLSMVIGLAVGIATVMIGFVIAISILLYIGCMELSDYIARKKKKPITHR